MGFMFVLPVLLASRETQAKHIVVVDAASGQFGLELEAGSGRSPPRHRTRGQGSFIW